MSSRLERRYRLLLRAYPADHRAAHGDEMLGVLLDTAGPGRTRPGLADSADVVRGGLLVRARRLDAAGWGDGLAVVALATTALACVMAPAVVGILVHGHHGPLSLAAFLAWPVVLAVGLAGLRRTAASIAVMTVFAISPASYPFGIALRPSEIWVDFGLLAAGSLVCSPGLRRGWEVLGRARGLALLGGAGLLSLLYLAQAYRYGPGHVGPLPGPAPLLLCWSAFGGGALLVAAAVFRIRTPAARRATIVLAAPVSAVVLVALDALATYEPRLMSWWILTDGPDLMLSGVAVAVAALACVTGSRVRSRAEN